MSDRAESELTPREAAVTLLTTHFGADEGIRLLWAWTCYPCSGEHEWEQAKALVRDGVPADAEVASR